MKLSDLVISLRFYLRANLLGGGVQVGVGVEIPEQSS